MYRSVLWLVPCLLRIQIWTLPVMVFETSFVAYLLVHCWELLLFVKEIYIHVTTLWLAVTCTYCEKEMYLRCVELVEWFFFFNSVYLHLYILIICIFVQFYSFPKQCDIFFFFLLWVIYSNIVIYEFINQDFYILVYTCMYYI